MKDMNCRMKSTPTKPTKKAYLMIFHSGWFLLMLNMLSAPLLRGEQMVISEVMYHPRGDKPEYIEFYNQTPTPLDMADWELRGGIHFDFPSFDPDLAEDGFAKAWERFVVSNVSPGELRAHYGIPQSIRVFGPWSGDLSDAGDSIILKDKNEVVLVRLDYDDDGRWPLAADGMGHALVLSSGDQSVNDWRAWKASERPDGTPGTEPIQGAETPIDSPELDLTQGIVLVDFGDDWRFHDDNENLGTSWRRVGFDDTSWKEGSGLFGFENSALPDPGIQTPLNDEDQLTYYFRKSFQFQGDPTGASLNLDMILDDGAVVYLNGTEVGRVRMPNGTINFTTTSAGGAVTNARLEEAVLQPAGNLLRSGTNELAVELHQTNTTSSDAVFGARLRLTTSSRSSVVINEVLPMPGDTGFIEIYNPLPVAVSLKGYFISDDPGRLDKAMITENLTVAPRGFQSTSYNDISLSAKTGTIVYLTEPDGNSPVSALSASISRDGRSIGRKPDGGTEWFSFTSPSPDGPNGSDGARPAIHINEVHYAEEGAIEWVELWNGGNSEISARSIRLAEGERWNDSIEIVDAIPSKGYLKVEAPFKVGRGRHILSVINFRDEVLDSHRFGSPGLGLTWQAFPKGSNEWYATADSTPSALNEPFIHDQIVINEIMFDPPSNQVRAEYIEILNRSKQTIDLSGWRFTEGVSFVFPLDTELKAGDFLVIAADLDWLTDVHGKISALGNYSGRLSNNGELLRLEDQWGNLADEVDYRVGGEWPEISNGGGSSLELTHPNTDNNFGSAWQASDESSKSQWQTYRYQGRYAQRDSSGSTSDYKEIYFHLVNDGHVMLKDVNFRRTRDGVNLIKTGNVMSTNNRSATGWLAQGTHWQTRIDGNGNLNIISDGRGDNRPNRVEIDITDIRRNDDCEIRFQARWKAGSSRLIFSTWDHSIANSFLIPIPENLGTPGARNSRARSSAPAQLARLNHSPAVPTTRDDVTISADVVSTEPLDYVRVYHRRDNSNNNGSWSFEEMHDDGATGGDLADADGRFTGLVTTHKQNRAIVQFYVEARTQSGNIIRLPRNAPELPGLYIVDTRSPNTDLRTMRFVVSAFDMGAISGGESRKYNYKFPRLANHYFNSTFISNEEDIYYNTSIRHTGSPWTRGNNLDRAKFKVTQDRPFRGRVKHRWDNDASNSGRRHHNRITRYMLYLLGHPVNENEFVQVMINAGSPQLREDTEPVGNEFLDRNFESGADGELYRIDDEWWFRDSWDRKNRDASWNYKNTDNPGNYRTEWMKRTLETEDDFTALINLFQTASGSYTQAQIERLADPDAIMKMFVVRGYIDDWDSISLRRGKNGYMYRRAADGKFQFIHWDSDLTFGNSGANFYQGLPGVNTYIRKDYNLRKFNYYMTELLEKYTKDSPRMLAWLDLEEDASRSYSINERTYTNWFNAREGRGFNLMRRYNNVSFKISTGNGETITTASESLEFKGQSAPGVYRVVVEGQPQASFKMNGMMNWTVSALNLKKGENQLKLHGLDQWGEVRETAEFTVNKTNNAKPTIAIEARPASWNVNTDQTLRLDVGASFDPEGDTLDFSWGTPADGIELIPDPSNQASARFAGPGWYDIEVTTEDSNGNMATSTRQASVFGRHGFSDFSALQLDPWWTIEQGKMADNQPEGVWFSLEDNPGHLTISMNGQEAHPWKQNQPNFPFISRSIPKKTDWSLHAKIALDSNLDQNFWTGLMAIVQENGQDVYYGIGLEGGDRLKVARKTKNGSILTIGRINLDIPEATIRIRRSDNTLRFETGKSGEWQTITTRNLPTNASASKGGIFMSAEQAVSADANVDFAMLVDPALTSDLVLAVRPTEIMYHPTDASGVEFIELTNVGENTLDLAGGEFIEGIRYLFAATSLQPQERIVIAGDRNAFLAFYGKSDIRLAEGSFDGRLADEGERVTFVDADGNVVFSVNYNDSGDWPKRADGFGSSLQVVNLRGDFNNPDHWAASQEVNGTPGVEGQTSPQAIVINEVLTHTDPPFEDAIELYNTSDAPVNVGRWFLSDNSNNYQKYQIPVNTVIAPRGFYVAYQRDFFASNPRVPFALNSAFGDEVHLTQSDAEGNAMAFVDTIAFPAAENGRSMGRFPDGSKSIRTLEYQTFGTQLSNSDAPENLDLFVLGAGAPNAEPFVGSVAVSRIMYHPTFGNDEYFELRNLKNREVALFDPNIPQNTWRIRGGVDLDLPTGIRIPPLGRLIVTELEPDVYRSKYEISNAVTIMGPYAGKLDNNGETIRLLRPDSPVMAPDPDAGFVPYLYVDEVKYNNELPWPRAADGLGAGLQRIDLAIDGSDAGNWTSFRPGIGTKDDLDEDGMSDVWEKLFGLDPSDASDAFLDTDGDGSLNIEEFLAQTDPTNAESKLRLDSLSLSDDGNRAIVRFQAQSGVTYAIETTAFIQSNAWKEIARTTPTTAPDLLEISLDIIEPLHQFYRLKVVE